MEEIEIWKPLLDYEGFYEVSNLGNVRSLDRIILNKNGRSYNLKGMNLKMSLDRDGYSIFSASKNGKRTTTKLHQAVWYSFNGRTNLHILHNIEGNPSNCRLDNLHIGNNRQNSIEYHTSKKTSSKYIGVNWKKLNKKWQSKISFNGKIIHLGLFSNELEAAKNYIIALTTIKIYQHE